MARRIAAQPVEVSGIRGALIVDLEAALNRLIGADSTSCTRPTTSFPADPNDKG